MLLFLPLFEFFHAVLFYTRHDYCDLCVQLIMLTAHSREAGYFEFGPDRQLGLLHLTWLLPGVAAIAVPGITKYNKLTTPPGGVQYTLSTAIPFRAHDSALSRPVRICLSRSSFKAAPVAIVCFYR